MSESSDGLDAIMDRVEKLVELPISDRLLTFIAAAIPVISRQLDTLTSRVAPDREAGGGVDSPVITAPEVKPNETAPASRSGVGGSKQT